tara:strand:+ start:371 stop:607 length:237 start_codon:yes stop_codon:yes gene_type:complete
MSLSTAYGYGDKKVLYIKILIEAFRYIVINAILAFVFFFLSLEEIDWSILSFRKKTDEQVIDNTSWNIKKIFLYLVKI